MAKAKKPAAAAKPAATAKKGVKVAQGAVKKETAKKVRWRASGLCCPLPACGVAHGARHPPPGAPKARTELFRGEQRR